MPKDHINYDIKMLIKLIQQEKLCPNILNYQAKLINNITESVSA
jgi:hypothetical protein